MSRSVGWMPSRSRAYMATSSMRRLPLSCSAISHSKSYMRMRDPVRGSATSKYLTPSSSAGVARRSCRTRGVVTLAASLELRQHQLGDRLEGVENADAGRGDRLVLRHVGRIEQLLELVHRGGVGHVPFVVLDDIGNLVEVVTLFLQVVAQVLERLDVRFHALDLRVGD